MKHATTAIALSAMLFLGAACSDSDDVTGAEEAANTANEVDEAADDVTAVTDAPDTDSDDTVAPDDDASESTDADAPIDGYLFEGATGDYTLVFPGEPTATPLPVALPTGQVTAEAFIYEDGLDAAYFTSVFDYPEGATDPDPEVALLGARDGAVANVGGTLLDSEFVELSGVPGISFSFGVDDGANSGSGRALVFFDEPRLYQSFALGFSDQDAEFQAFLDTFTFTAEVGDS